MHIKTLSIFKIITLVIAVTTGLSFVYAEWTPPSVAPPTETDMVKLIDTGSPTATKAGLLYFKGSIQVGSGATLECASGLEGAMRWNNGNNGIGGNYLEVCSGTAWKILTVRRSNCTGAQYSRDCEVQGASYDCNCGKDGCDTCFDTEHGTQYEVRFICTPGNISVTTGWSECIPTP